MSKGLERERLDKEGLVKRERSIMSIFRLPQRDGWNLEEEADLWSRATLRSAGKEASGRVHTEASGCPGGGQGIIIPPCG